MRHEGDDHTFPLNTGGSAPIDPAGTVFEYALMPPAIQFESEWHARNYDLGHANDQLAIVNDRGTIDETMDGLEWAQDQIGGSTMTLDTDGFPPHLRITTGASDTNGQNMQASIGDGLVREIFDFSIVTDAFLSITLRLSEITQSQFFFGLSPTDTTILAGMQDFIGLHKADGSNIINIVGDAASVAPGSASSLIQLIDLSTFSRAGATMNDLWMRLAFRVIGQKVHGFAQNGQEVSAGRLQLSHRATLNLQTNTDLPANATCPSFACATGAASAETFDIANISTAAKYVLGQLCVGR